MIRVLLASGFRLYAGVLQSAAAFCALEATRSGLRISHYFWCCLLCSAYFSRHDALPLSIGASLSGVIATLSRRLGLDKLGHMEFLPSAIPWHSLGGGLCKDLIAGVRACRLLMPTCSACVAPDSYSMIVYSCCESSLLRSLHTPYIIVLCRVLVIQERELVEYRDC